MAAAALAILAGLAGLTAAYELREHDVDVYEATEGHDFCAADPWVAGRSPDPAIGTAAPHHPYLKVQQVGAVPRREQHRAKKRRHLASSCKRTFVALWV